MTRCLITGCSGFIGSHLAELLVEKGVTIYGAVHQNTKNIDQLGDKIPVFKCDMLDDMKLGEIVLKSRPDFVFHLAAQNSIARSWQEPENTLKVNILGTLYLLESIRKAGLDPLIEVVCSSAEYGFNSEHGTPIKEDSEFKPSSPYAVSKIGQDMLAYLYWHAHNMRIIRIRPFYVVGPRKTFDALSDFAKGIVEIERERRGVLDVGNLETVRDVVDVRDCVKALWLLMEKGESGSVYNISSGKGYKIRDLLNTMLSFSTKKIEVREDPMKMRPSDEPILIGDISALSKIGWKPQIPIEKTLSDILNYWREQIV